MSTTSATNSKPARGSAVKVKTNLPKAEGRVATTRYWIGTTPECPIQNVTVGGVSFPRFRGNPVFDQPGGAPDREIVHGAMVQLTEEQVALVAAGVRIRCIRIYSPTTDENIVDNETVRRKVTSAHMLMTDSASYRPAPEDVPLARFLYMHRLDDMSAADLSRFPPETMESA